MRTSILCTITACVAGSLLAADTSTPSWSEKSAAAYLDGRMDWWSTWKSSARDHDTFCVSCHTALPYALGRQALRAALRESGPSPLEQKLLDNVTKRVRLWWEVDPFYPDAKSGAGKTVESRGTESVLNALILVRNSPRGGLSPDAELALTNMWGQQITTGAEAGAWPWLQFHNAPWEGDSQFFGSTLAVLAIGGAPPEYRAAPERRQGLGELRQYLSREWKSQKLIDQVMLLWASSELPDLLTKTERDTIIADVRGKQREDGGFSMAQFVADWKRKDGTPLETQSDGYATAMVATALQELEADRKDPTLQKSLLWLSTHQQADGRWAAWSLNKQRDPASDPARFMSDAATAFAVLALEFRGRN